MEVPVEQRCLARRQQILPSLLPVPLSFHPAVPLSLAVNASKGTYLHLVGPCRREIYPQVKECNSVQVQISLKGETAAENVSDIAAVSDQVFA